MKITVLGAGAMGSLFGGLLSEAGHDVWLLDRWQEHVNLINQCGLSIEGVDETKRVKTLRATSHPSLIGISDIVLVFVKSPNTEAALRQSHELFAPETLAVTLQNGLGNIEHLISVVQEDRIIAGTTSHGATVLQAGTIRHAGAGATVIGRLDGRIDAGITGLADIFNLAHIQTTLSTNVSGIIWDKLLVNVGINALTALTRLQNGQLLDYTETEEILELAVEEALKIAQAKHIELCHDDPVAYTKTVCTLTAANTSSMSQDVLYKRKTEIETINGAIVREGLKTGISTPVNTILTNLVLMLEKNY